MLCGSVASDIYITWEYKSQFKDKVTEKYDSGFPWLYLSRTHFPWLFSPWQTQTHCYSYFPLSAEELENIVLLVYNTEILCDLVLTNNLSFLVLCPFSLSTFHSILLCRLALNMWPSAWMLGWQVWPLWLAIYFLFYSNYFWLLSKYL